ncbi:MAG TPA: hypothetical protein VIF57_11480 [Polyangia bacterium]|jgi:hypothetical protein
MPAALRRGIVALVAAVLAPLTARAADIPLIRIFPPACETGPVSVDDFVDALRVELAGRQPHCCVVGPGGDPTTDAVKVTLSIEPCDAATEQVDVVVDITAPPHTTQRPVSLADLPPEARPRALALAVAELIRTAGESAQALPPGPPPPEKREAPFAALNGSVVGDVRHHFGQGTTLWGARLGLSLVFERWQATLDAGAATSNTDVSAGSINLLLASGALFVGPRFAVGPIAVSLGPTGALGFVRMKGQSTSLIPSEGTFLVGTAGLRAAIEAPARHAVRAYGYAEGGLTIRHLEAEVDGAPAAGISGPYIMFAAGLRFGPGY